MADKKVYTLSYAHDCFDGIIQGIFQSLEDAKKSGESLLLNKLGFFSEPEEIQKAIKNGWERIEVTNNYGSEKIVDVFHTIEFEEYLIDIQEMVIRNQPLVYTVNED